MVETDAKSRILSPALIGFFRRRLMELCGLFLVLAGLALTATLFSPGRYDPSFSAFSSGGIENWFGAIGAHIAGALRVSLGSASFFLTLLPIGWGYRLVRKQSTGYRLARLFLSPVALFSLRLACVGWQVPTAMLPVGRRGCSYRPDHAACAVASASSWIDHHTLCRCQFPVRRGFPLVMVRDVVAPPMGPSGGTVAWGGRPGGRTDEGASRDAGT